MRIQFESLSPLGGPYLRHEMTRPHWRTLWVNNPGDLSVEVDPACVDEPCDLCLTNEPHSLRLHRNLLDPPRSDLMEALRDVITAMPFPVIR